MKNFFYLIVLFISISAYAQDPLDKIAKESCSCIEKKKLDYTKDSDIKAVQMALGMCIVESFSAHQSKFSKKELSEFEGEGGMRKLGEKVAMKMVSYCPDVIMAMGKKYLDDKGEENGDDEVVQEDIVEADPTIEGTITAIEKNQFVTIKVKDKNNRVHSFLLLDYFETASLYTENKIKVGDALTVGYSEIELFDSTSNDFKYFKIISLLEKK
jgi:hypothetical protein